MPSNPLTIAICGPSSAGKTTLALLLQSIFADFGPQANISPVIVHEDAFFKPKEQCPRIGFLCCEKKPGKKETEEDDRERAFIERCMEAQEGALYTIKPQHSGFYVEGPETDWLVPFTIPSYFILLFVSKTNMTISHSWSAIDIPLLLSTLQTLTTDPLPTEPFDPLRPIPFETAAGSIQKRFPDLIARLREEVRQRTHHLQEKPVLVFVEGFMLFPRPDDDNDNQERAEEKRQLAQSLPIKLFLPTSRSTASARRFRRKVYIDAEPGGGRLVGQCWKTRGYFENVAWKNWQREHMDVGERDGVKVREGDDSVEGTANWAVGVILEVLGV